MNICNPISFEWKCKPRQLLSGDAVNHYSDIYEENGRRWKLSISEFQHENGNIGELLHVDPMKRNIGMYFTYVSGSLPLSVIFTFMAKSITTQVNGWKMGPSACVYTEYGGRGFHKAFTLETLKANGCYDSTNDELTLGIHIQIHNSAIPIWMSNSTFN